MFKPEGRSRYASLVLVLSAAIAIPIGASAARGFDGYLAVRMFVFRAAVYGAAVFIALLALTAIVRTAAKQARSITPAIRIA